MQENNAVPAAENTNIALLPPAERAVIVLDSSKTEAQLRELVQQSADITEVKDKAGREQAHRAGMNLKNVRNAITSTGKAARDDANAFSKAVIAEEKRLIAISQAEEDRIFTLRDAYDAEQARIKAEAERKEAERKARIQGMIAAVRNIPVALAGRPAAELADEIAELESFKAGEEFAEFNADADAAALTALATLRDMHTRQVAAEAEAARVAAERAELERLRAEAAERERVAADERRQQEQALAAEREALAAERRALEEQKAAAAREAEAKADPAAPVAVEPAVDTTTSTITVVETVATGDDTTIAIASADLPPDEADEAAEAALRAKVTALDTAVSDLLAMNVTADQVRELVDLAIVAAGMKVAA